MKCAWQAYLDLLPVWMRGAVDKRGRDTLEELRLRINLPAEMVMKSGSVWLDKATTTEDLQYCVNVASRYSPWAAATASKGYITARGGHRIGLCGSAVIANGSMTGIRSLSSLCLRVARDFPDIAAETVQYSGSILVIGRPGSGKTTLLRDMIRKRAASNCATVAVVDEREEIFPKIGNTFCFSTGPGTDVMSGCGKAEGIEAVLRSMRPDIIAVDEITAEEDCSALLHAGWCGVKLLATAHAGSKEELLKRPVYAPIIKNRLFDTLIVLNKDKSWYAERMVG